MLPEAANAEIVQRLLQKELAEERSDFWDVVRRESVDFLCILSRSQLKSLNFETLKFVVPGSARWWF